MFEKMDLMIAKDNKEMEMAEAMDGGNAKTPLLNPFQLPTPDKFPHKKEYDRVQEEFIDDYICKAIAESDLNIHAIKTFVEQIRDKRDGRGILTSVLRPSRSHGLRNCRQYSGSTAALDGVTRATIDEYRGFVDVDLVMSHSRGVLHLAKLAGMDVSIYERFVQDTESVFEEIKAVHDPTGEARLTVKHVKNIPNILLNGGSYDTWIRNTTDGEEVRRWSFTKMITCKKRGIPIQDGKCSIALELQSEMTAIRQEIINANWDAWSSFLKEKNPQKGSEHDRNYRRRIENKIVNIFNEFHEAEKMDEMRDVLESEGFCRREQLVNEWDGEKFPPLQPFGEDGLQRVNKRLQPLGGLVALKTFGKARQDIIARAREFKTTAEASMKRGGGRSSDEAMTDEIFGVMDEGESQPHVVTQSPSAGGGGAGATPAKRDKRKVDSSAGGGGVVSAPKGKKEKASAKKKKLAPAAEGDDDGDDDDGDDDDGDKAKKKAFQPFRPLESELKWWDDLPPEEKRRITTILDLLGMGTLDEATVPEAMGEIWGHHVKSLGKLDKWAVWNNNTLLWHVEDDAFVKVKALVTKKVRTIFALHSNKNLQHFASVRLGRASTIANIVKGFGETERVRDSTFMDKMDKAKGFLATRGGRVFNFADNTSRPRNQTDLWTYEAKARYLEDHEWTPENEAYAKHYFDTMIVDRPGPDGVPITGMIGNLLDVSKATIAGKKLKTVTINVGAAGDNGKTTFFECVLRPMLGGKLMATAANAVFLKTRSTSEITTHLGVLEHARLAYAKEFDANDVFDTKGQKTIASGEDGDFINHRGLHAANRDIETTCNLWAHTNVIPKFSSLDKGFLNRLCIILFNQKYTEKSGFKVELAAHLSDIFTYIVRHGNYVRPFVLCAEGRAAVAHQMQLNTKDDLLPSFLAAKYQSEKLAKPITGSYSKWCTSADDLLSDFIAYREKHGQKTGHPSKTALTLAMKEHGYDNVPSGKLVWYLGLWPL